MILMGTVSYFKMIKNVDGDEIEMGEQQKKKDKKKTPKVKKELKEEEKDEIVEEKKAEALPRTTSFAPRATLKSNA